MRSLLPILLLCLVAPAAGCGTLYNQNLVDGREDKGDTLRVYGGVRKDFETAQDCLKEKADGPNAALEKLVTRTSVGLFLATDLPLCAVADTICLPSTLKAALVRALDDSPVPPPAQPPKEAARPATGPASTAPGRSPPQPRPEPTRSSAAPPIAEKSLLRSPRVDPELDDFRYPGLP